MQAIRERMRKTRLYFSFIKRLEQDRRRITESAMGRDRPSGKLGD
jgi:hypothetical protein